MSTDNDWIKRSDMLPKQEDTPIWCYNESANDGVTQWLWPRKHFDGMAEYTHWKRATIPAPPAKARTQREEDEQAYRTFEQGGAILAPYLGKDRQTAWHCALAYRDAQNRTDVQALEFNFVPTQGKEYQINPAYGRLRKRCNLP